MRSTLEEEEEVAPPSHSQAQSNDREVTLSSTTLLAIFFGLALLCALFFAFGYTIGRRAPSDSAQLAASQASSQGDLQTATPQSKPPAGASTSIPATPDPTAADLTADPNANQPTPTQTSPAAASPAPTSPAPVVSDTFASTPPASPAPQPPPAPTQFTVQIAAVSNPADADVLIGALHKRGYTVAARHDAADSLIHVQIGPFSSRADALAMRQKLLSDGYNAILK